MLFLFLWECDFGVEEEVCVVCFDDDFGLCWTGVEEEGYGFVVVE